MGGQSFPFGIMGVDVWGREGSMDAASFKERV